MELPLDRGTKVYITGPGHMTKVAATPIYETKLQQSSSQEPEVHDLVFWHAALGTEPL